MKVEVDQSGKMEQLNTGTAVAYSNGKSGAIWLSTVTKQELIRRLRKTLIPHRHLWTIMFAIAIFTMIEKLDSNVILVIDEEYTGKEEILSETLIKLLQRRFKDKWNGDVRFSRIGKSSGAHKLAWEVHHQKNKQRVKEVTVEEIVRWIK